MYPITPQTHIVEYLSKFVSDGELNSRLIKVESEQSAISSVIGAQATGVRTFTATSSQGLLYMTEMLFIASGMRLPIVMAVANRAVSAPINIWNDHQDSISIRDSGWMQFYVESSQEIMDTIIKAYKISEKVNIPSMVCLDGFNLSHVYEPVDILGQGEVDKFLPKYNPKYKLDWKNPITMGSLGAPNTYMEFKYQQQKAMNNTIKTIKDVNKEFYKLFGRKYGDGLVEIINPDAKTGIIAAGSITGTIESVIKKYKNVGLVKLKTFRPFPKKELIKACSNFENIAVIDRNISFGFGGAKYGEIKSILPDKKITNFIMGLGGRDITENDIKFVIKNVKKEKEIWVNVNDTWIT